MTDSHQDMSFAAVLGAGRGGEPLTVGLTSGEALDLMLDHLSDGRYDSRLELIAGELAARQRIVYDELTRRNIRKLTPGTAVRITPGINPGYLVGRHATVVERPQDRPVKPGLIYVDVGERVRKYGPVIGVPAACVERV